MEGGRFFFHDLMAGCYRNWFQGRSNFCQDLMRGCCRKTEKYKYFLTFIFISYWTCIVAQNSGRQEYYRKHRCIGLSLGDQRCTNIIVAVMSHHRDWIQLSVKDQSCKSIAVDSNSIFDIVNHISLFVKIKCSFSFCLCADVFDIFFTRGGGFE